MFLSASARICNQHVKVTGGHQRCFPSLSLSLFGGSNSQRFHFYPFQTCCHGAGTPRGRLLHPDGATHLQHQRLDLPKEKVRRQIYASGCCQEEPGRSSPWALLLGPELFVVCLHAVKHHKCFGRFVSNFIKLRGYLKFYRLKIHFIFTENVQHDRRRTARATEGH